MNDEVFVRMRQRLRGLERDADRLLDRQGPVPPKSIAEALAAYVRHREPEPAGCFAGVVDGQHVRMLQRRGEPDLTLEPFRPQRHAGFGIHDLERDRPAVFDVGGEVDDSHAAAAQLPLEHVPIPERISESLHAGCFSG